MSNCVTIKTFQIFFSVCCYLVTLALLVFCCNIYFKNENITEIKYKKFNDDSISPYPSISICSQLAPNMFKEDKLKDRGIETNASSYHDFLKGKFWDEKMLDVNYEEVTAPMESYVLYSRAFKNFDPDLKQNGIAFQKIKADSLPTYMGVYKCITFDLPNEIQKRIKYATIVLENSIFTNGMFPENEKFLSHFHFPNYLYGTSIGTKWSWQSKNLTSSYVHRVLQFTITSTEVLNRRNKGGNTCIHHTDHDKDYKDKAMEAAGCIPPYWKTTRNFSRCQSQTQMKILAREAFKAYNGHLEDVRDIVKPCIELKKITFSHSDTEYDIKSSMEFSRGLELKNNDSITKIFIDFANSDFKEIKEVEAFGIESLVGNVGGYIGLFLGLSIIQLPTFCVFLGQRFTIRGKEVRDSQRKLPIMTKSSIEIYPKQKDNRKDINTKERFEAIEESLIYILDRMK